MKTDERYGMDRLALIKARDHKRKVASLLKYHYVSVEILAKCCMGLNPQNKTKVCALASDIDGHARQGPHTTNPVCGLVRGLEACWRLRAV